MLRTPIYYHGIQVGRISDYRMLDDGDIQFDIYVKKPYDEKIYNDTRFWNAGGIDITLDATGIRLQTASLTTLLAGGVAFGMVPILTNPSSTPT